jgi:hypothetical protein
MAVGALVLVGMLAGQGAANAQFAFGMTRYGYNPNNPFVAQQQYLANLQANRYAIAAGAQVPAWLPYVAPYTSPAYFPPYINSGFGSYGHTAPVYNPYLYNTNPYLSTYGSYLNTYGSPYNPYLTNPYSAYLP